jgi:hypothetical protein
MAITDFHSLALRKLGEAIMFLAFIWRAGKWDSFETRQRYLLS